MPNFNIFSGAAIAIFIGFIVVFLIYIKDLFSSRSKLQQKEDIEMEKVREKSYTLMHDAIKKSEEIMGNAALEEMQITKNAKLISGDLEAALDSKLSQTTSQIQALYQERLAALAAQVEGSNKNFAQYLDQLKQNSTKTQEETQQILRGEINKIFENFEQNLSNFLTETEQRSVRSIELELQSTRQLIDTYKQQQLTLIDENIIAMLERTLSLVLTKKLTLKDQTDLVYEALEQAKIEKFIA